MFAQQRRRRRQQHEKQQHAAMRLAQVCSHVASASADSQVSRPCSRHGDPSEQHVCAAPFEFDVTPPLGTPLMDGGVAAAAQIKTHLTARGVLLHNIVGGAVILCSVDWVGICNESHDLSLIHI